MQLVVALLQLLALGQQGPLVHQGAHELRNRRAFALGNLDAGDVQVTLHLFAVAQAEDHFLHFAAPGLARQHKTLGHAVAVDGADERHEGDKQPVMAFGLEGVVSHGIRLDDHVMLIEHQQGQWHTGEQGLEAFRGTLGHGLAVIQHLVLDFQLVLVVAQLGDQGRQRVVAQRFLAHLQRRQHIQRGGVQFGQQILDGRGSVCFAGDQKGKVWATHGRQHRQRDVEAQCKRPP